MKQKPLTFARSLKGVDSQPVEKGFSTQLDAKITALRSSIESEETYKAICKEIYNAKNEANNIAQLFYKISYKLVGFIESKNILGFQDAFIYVLSYIYKNIKQLNGNNFTVNVVRF